MERVTNVIPRKHARERGGVGGGRQRQTRSTKNETRNKHETPSTKEAPRRGVSCLMSCDGLGRWEGVRGAQMGGHGGIWRDRTGQHRAVLGGYGQYWAATGRSDNMRMYATVCQTMRYVKGRPGGGEKTPRGASATRSVLSARGGWCGRWFLQVSKHGHPDRDARVAIGSDHATRRRAPRNSGGTGRGGWTMRQSQN